MGSFQTAITIKDAIDNIDSNRYLIPAFQREFVWTSEQIENLFDSLMRGYPISSMLFWKVEKESRSAYQYYQFLQNYVEEYHIHTQPKAGCESMESFLAILDGQQRLTSLFLGLKGSVAYHAKYRPWDKTERNFPTLKLYLNLSHTGHQEEGAKQYVFKFRPRIDGHWNDLIIENEEKWFRVGAILTIDSLLDFSFSNKLTSNEYKMVEQLKDVVNKPVINYYLETDVAADKAVDIFVRINSGGRPLSISDILMSIVVAGWKDNDARQEMKDLLAQIGNKGFKVNHDYVIKSLQYLLDKPVQSKITTFNSQFIKETEEKWDDIRDCILSLFSLLKVYGLDDSTLTSYNATLPILYYIYKRGIYKDVSTSTAHIAQRGVIKNWLLKALLLKSFGGSSDSTLEQARRSIGINESLFPSESVSKGIKQPTTLDQDSIDEILSTQKDQAYAFPILALFYPNIDTSNKFNMDHLHPAALFDSYCKEMGYAHKDKQAWSRYNSLVNLQMLGENENKSKSDMPLKEWVLKTGKDRTALEKETYLPKDVSLEIEDFDIYYSKRKELLKCKLLEVLGITLAQTQLSTKDSSNQDSNKNGTSEVVTPTLAALSKNGKNAQGKDTGKYIIVRGDSRDDNSGKGYGKPAIAEEFAKAFFSNRKLEGDLYDAANGLMQETIGTTMTIFKPNPSKAKVSITLADGQEIVLDKNIWGQSTDCWRKLYEYLTKDNPYFVIRPIS